MRMPGVVDRFKIGNKMMISMEVDVKHIHRQPHASWIEQEEKFE
jgi:hypothetical protein